jgi:hypothetical protein
MKALFVLIFIFIAIQGFTQLSPFTENIFRSEQLVNIPTINTLPAGSMSFNIQHRFGKADIQNELLKDFFGMDLTANIRFGFTFPITQKITAGIGRTKQNDTYDADIKYVFLQQRKDNKIPVSAGVYANVAYMSDDFPSVKNNYFETHPEKGFTYKNIHRFTYTFQMIVARKFGRNVSFEIAPLLVHRNLTEPGEHNNTWAIPAGGRLKVTTFSSVLIEYAPIINKDENVLHPFSVGYEIGTAGHSFQLIAGNNDGILPGMIYTSEKGADMLKGQFYLGFNIHRTLWLNKKKKTEHAP